MKLYVDLGTAPTLSNYLGEIVAAEQKTKPETTDKSWLFKTLRSFASAHNNLYLRLQVDGKLVIDEKTNKVITLDSLKSFAIEEKEEKPEGHYVELTVSLDLASKLENAVSLVDAFNTINGITFQTWNTFDGWLKSYIHDAILSAKTKLDDQRFEEEERLLEKTQKPAK